jgi:ATP-dependent helicase IRC3
MSEERNFYREYNLVSARKVHTKKEPASHQAAALDHLYSWYDSNPKPHAGGILVLPTGGGKTFAGVRFLTRKALSDGYKVLWLAHTHHLLEQAFHSIGDDVGQIAEPRISLHVRAVSGGIGYYPVQTIKPNDDVIIATLQTITKAYKERHPSLEKFIDEAKGKLFIIFDEAHHAPAPSYRKLVSQLRDRCSKTYLLGLTATPTYSDEDAKGWLAKLFPQGIIYQVSAEELMSAGILSKPIIEPLETQFTPNFDPREYQKWTETFRDLPEDIISQLAENLERNLYIAETYAKNRKKYGKTIIFADRAHQCEAISKFLQKRGVNSGTIYSHVDANLGCADARNKRKSDENTRVLEAFRKGEIDVVLNIRMLTEGTDVPDVKSVFLTRQTTSKILLTQMIGRALRGPKFGGTEEAYIVSFIDNWKQLIGWAEYDQLSEIGACDTVDEYSKRPPVQFISIELVRNLAAQMDRGININVGPFKTLLPLGWYLVDYPAQQGGSEEIERIRRMVMVFDHEERSYKELVEHLPHETLTEFMDEGIQFNNAKSVIINWQKRFFPHIEEHFGSNLTQDIFSIARHIAQKGVPPRFFSFEERDRHDLDLVAKDLLTQKLSRVDEDNAVSSEYNRSDRYWKVLYPTFRLFKYHYNGCVERMLDAVKHNMDTETYRPPMFITPEEPPKEISDELKDQVKNRDGGCVCCGMTSGRLDVDHIAPKHFGGSNILDNLQTLCKKCNQLKGTNYINFRDCQTDLTMPLDGVPEFEMPTNTDAGDAAQWARFISRIINFFYKCGAVHGISIGSRGEYFYHWWIQLNAGNDPRWLKPHLPRLLKRIRNAKEEAGYGAPSAITVWAPDMPEVSYSIKSKE